MKTIGTLFSGGEGVGVGARQAGLDHLWGVEWDDKIASVGRMNGFNTITGDVRDVDLMRSLPRPDVIHASPVCKNASNAKADGEESPEDIATADAVCAYVNHFKPDIFTLENVWGYRTFTAFAHIIETLNANKYHVDYWHVNSANYGIIRPCPLHDSRCIKDNARNVVKDFDPASLMIAPDIAATLAMMKPADQAIHLANDAAANLVKEIQLDTAANVAWRLLVNGDSRQNLIRIGRVEDSLMSADISKLGSTEGIDENIELLLSKCLDARLIQEKLSIISMETLRITLLKILKCLRVTVSIPNYTTKIDQRNLDGGLVIDGDCPLCKIIAVPQTRQRLILVARLNGKPRKPLATHARPDKLTPMFDTRLPWVGWYAAIEDLIDTLPASKFAPWQLERLPSELMEPTLVNSAFPESNGRKDYSANEPAFSADTLTINHMKAFIVNGGNAGRDLTVSFQDDPYFTLAANGQREAKRAWLSTGRVVKMTTRALARLQSFPDSYILPDKTKLACTVIGNAVPPLLYQRVIEAQR